MDYGIMFRAFRYQKKIREHLSIEIPKHMTFDTGVSITVTFQSGRLLFVDQYSVIDFLKEKVLLTAIARTITYAWFADLYRFQVANVIKNYYIMTLLINSTEART